jgi:DSF synthase
VLTSGIPGIFNLGGDLTFFAHCIRTGNREALTTYAHACANVLHLNTLALDLPIIMIALVNGDALGGGFESALAFDVIIAEKSAKFGLPEILFNLFPGMGAYSFLSRRLDAARAEKIILSGKIYDAEELHAMGVIDVVAEDGQGREAVYEYMTRTSRRHAAHVGINRVRRRVRPLLLEELRDVTDIWVDTAMQLTDGDLRKMERLAASQARRLAENHLKVR